MQRISRFLVLGAAFAAASLGLAGPAAAKSKPAPAPEWYQYTVTFTCGHNDSGFSRVVPGEFATAVNLYNATAGDTIIHKNLALTFPPESPP